MHSISTAVILLVCFVVSIGLAPVSAQQVIISPKAIRIPAPHYPQEALKAQRGGRVVVSVSIDKSGHVTTAGKIDGPNAPCSNLNDPSVKSLRNAAKIAAKEALFTPGTINGKFSADLGTSITYIFNPKEAQTTGVEGLVMEGGWVPLKGELLNPKALKLPKARYPSDLTGTLYGTVYVTVVVAEDGSVSEAGAYFGFAGFSESVVSAACKAKFPPTFENGIPVKTTGVIGYSFGN